MGGGPTRFGVLGDSISNDSVLEWPGLVRFGYRDNYATLSNHASAGESIAGHMATQVTAAASDNANIIIIALGTNDNNAGDMGALQATYEAGIVALKATNPNATIYAMNVLPRWEDETTGAEVDKSNIRTAIAAACTAQSVTCWDTYTTPWIDQDETVDGTHPDATGQAAIAAEVLSRL